MASWKAASFRQRARLSDRATQKFDEQRRQHVSASTREALQKFEENLQAQQEAMYKEFDAIPAEAGSMMVRFGDEEASTAPPSAPKPPVQEQLSRSHSTPITPTPAGAEKDPSTRRPPSPLGLYDYGSLSLKPRSLFSQYKCQVGEPVRPKHRQQSCGFYFPGTQCKHGPYGFSMIEPCLLPPRNWAENASVPTRWSNDLGNARPLDAQALGFQRDRSAASGASPSVRTTQAHVERARRSYQVLDKQREEAVLEQARFENGVYEGKWRDPLLESKGRLPEVCPPENHDWLRLAPEEMTPSQQMAARIIFGLFDRQTKFKGGLAALLAPENRGGPGVLEPEELQHALVRLGIMAHEECPVENLVQAIFAIDRGSSGRVSLPALSRAVGVARGLRKQQRQATQERKQQRQVFLNTKYSDSVPVDIVKLDKNSKSLYNFERALDKFRSQQRELLIQHNELDGGEHE